MDVWEIAVMVLLAGVGARVATLSRLRPENSADDIGSIQASKYRGGLVRQRTIRHSRFANSKVFVVRGWGFNPVDNSKILSIFISLSNDVLWREELVATLEHSNAEILPSPELFVCARDQ